MSLGNFRSNHFLTQPNLDQSGTRGILEILHTDSKISGYILLSTPEILHTDSKVPGGIPEILYPGSKISGYILEVLRTGSKIPG